MSSRTKRGALAAAALIAGSLLASHAALAFKCTPAGDGSEATQHWGVRSIPWAVNSAYSDDIADKDATLEAIRLAFQAWEDVECSDVTLPFLGPRANLVRSFSTTGANVNAVVFVEQGWSVTDENTLAFTSLMFDPTTGVIFDADIELNGESFHFANVSDPPDDCTSDVDVRNVVTHEVGHLLGLDHPPASDGSEETTMYATSPACELKKRTLEQDDIDGVCTIYPTGAPGKPCPRDDGGCGCTAVEGPDGPGALTAAMLVAMFAARALSRRARRGAQG